VRRGAQKRCRSCASAAQQQAATRACVIFELGALRRVVLHRGENCYTSPTAAVEKT
jgi:hypothetical protein